MRMGRPILVQFLDTLANGLLRNFASYSIAFTLGIGLPPQYAPRPFFGPACSVFLAFPATDSVLGMYVDVVVAAKLVMS